MFYLVSCSFSIRVVYNLLVDYLLDVNLSKLRLRQTKVLHPQIAILILGQDLVGVGASLFKLLSDLQVSFILHWVVQEEIDVLL